MKDQINTTSSWSFTPQRMVLAAIFGAVIFAMYLVKIAFFPVPNISDAATVLATPVSLAGIIGGPIAGLLAGAVFSLVTQITFGAAFPWYVLIPGRPLIGLVAWAVYKALSTVMNDKIAAAVAGALGSITNTVVTLGIAMFVGLIPSIAALYTFLPQIIFEAVLAAVICPVVVVAVRAALGGRRLPL